MNDTCSHCGAPRTKGAQFCGQCGQPYISMPPVPPSQTAAPIAPPPRRNSRRRVIVTIVAVFVVVALCVFGGSEALKILARNGIKLPWEPSASNPANPAPRVLATKTQTIGPEGGTIVMDNGVRLVFPAEAMAQKTEVRINQLDPADFLEAQTEGILLDLSAPVTSFQKNFELHIPLPGWITANDTDAVIAGVVDETTGAINYEPSFVQVTSGKPELIIQTDHFSWRIIEWWKENYGTPPPQAGPLQIPYYSQSKTFCWAGMLQMLAETAHHSETSEEYSIIGHIGVDEDGLGARAARTYPSISGLMKAETGAWPERFIWLKGTDTALRSYIRRQTGLMGRPVGLNYGKHAVVFVGYDGADFYVHDPQGMDGDIYKRASWDKLGLSNNEDKTTVVVPLPLAGDRPLVTVNIKDSSLEFFKPTTATESDTFQFRWDFTRRDGGYSFYSYRANKTVATIPGEVTEFRFVRSGAEIEIVNSDSSGGPKDVSVRIEIIGKGPAKTHYSDQKTVRAAPGIIQKVKFDPINVDDFRDPAPAPTEYTFRVTAAVGGKTTDDASFTFILEAGGTRTPTTTSSATLALTATLQTPVVNSLGEWVLQAIILNPVKTADTLCYFDHQVALGDGSFTSSGAWKDEGCRAEGGPYFSGTVLTTCSWSPPPSYLKAGTKLSSSMTCQATAQQTGGDRSGGGQGWMFLTLNPDANNLAGRYGWSSKFLGDVLATGWTSSFPKSDSKSGSIQVPSGRKGDVLVIVIFTGGAGGSGTVVYKYAYNGTDPVPPRDPPVTPGPVTDTPTPTFTVTPTVTRTATRTATPPASPEPPRSTPSATVSAGEQQIFKVNSIGVALNGATAPTRFSTSRSWLVTKIVTYHWNNGRGATPGSISLRASDGTVYGPWKASGEPGSGGVLNAYWVVRPNVLIPSDTYTVIDSDPGTWAQNQDTGGRGMAWGDGIPK